MDKRPPLNKHISVKDFSEFYWLKKELTAFCRSEGLMTTGKKGELADRIIEYLRTGTKATGQHSKVVKPTSAFDWLKKSYHFLSRLQTTIKTRKTSGRFSKIRLRLTLSSM